MCEGQQTGKCDISLDTILSVTVGTLFFHKMIDFYFNQIFLPKKIISF